MPSVVTTGASRVDANFKQIKCSPTLGSQAFSQTVDRQDGLYRKIYLSGSGKYILLYNSDEAIKRAVRKEIGQLLDQ